MGSIYVVSFVFVMILWLVVDVLLYKINNIARKQKEFQEGLEKEFRRLSQELENDVYADIKRLRSDLNDLKKMVIDDSVKAGNFKYKIQEAAKSLLDTHSAEVLDDI